MAFPSESGSMAVVNSKNSRGRRIAVGRDVNYLVSYKAVVVAR